MKETQLQTHILRRRTALLRLTYTAVCLALALVLPFLTGQLRELGQAFSPMHLPVLLCGYFCGWPWGLVCGFVAPILRSVCFGMPQMFPSAVGMAFELAAYGFLTGLLFRLLPKKLPYIYGSLIAAMLGGRAVGGLVNLVLLGLGSIPSYSLSVFWSSYFVGTWPGMVVQLILVPLLVEAMRRAGLLYYGPESAISRAPDKS